MTQKEQLLWRLKGGPVCSQSFYTDSKLTHRLAAYVHALEKDGYRIVHEACTVHSHGSRAVRYSLAPEGALF